MSISKLKAQSMATVEKKFDPSPLEYRSGGLERHSVYGSNLVGSTTFYPNFVPSCIPLQETTIWLSSFSILKYSNGNVRVAVNSHIPGTTGGDPEYERIPRLLKLANFEPTSYKECVCGYQTDTRVKGDLLWSYLKKTYKMTQHHIDIADALLI